MQGSEFLLEHNNSQKAKAQVLEQCKKFFRPEFINRLDELVLFEPLSPVHLREVARLLVAELAQRLAERNVTMTMTDEGLDFAVKKSYDHLYGARPLRRWLVSPQKLSIRHPR